MPTSQTINVYHRERHIKAIQNSFEVNNRSPVHVTSKNLRPAEVMLLLPYFERHFPQGLI
uniref:Sec13-like protein n=1 Tax=Rhizophora mucronata TaxID=61149 RepID=A0A2P2KUY6_RHIMU